MCSVVIALIRPFTERNCATEARAEYVDPHYSEYLSLTIEIRAATLNVDCAEPMPHPLRA